MSGYLGVIGSYNYCTKFSELNRTLLNRTLFRPSHLKILGGPKMAHAGLNRWAIDGPCALMYNGQRGDAS